MQLPHKLTEQHGYISLTASLQLALDFLYCLRQIFVIIEDERITIWIILIIKKVDSSLKT